MNILKICSVSVLILSLCIGCASEEKVRINHDESSYNYTAYTSEEFTKVPSSDITIYTNRLDMRGEFIELGVIEFKSSINKSAIKKLVGSYGATAIYKKNATNYLLLRNKNYHPPSYEQSRT